jgi:hypothetical protein
VSAPAGRDFPGTAGPGRGPRPGGTARLESGRANPRLDTIYELLPGLGVTLTEFSAEFEHILRAQNSSDVPKRKGTRAERE